MAGWDVPPSEFIDEVEQQVSQRIRVIALALLNEVVLRSPVGNPDLWQGAAPEGYVGGRFRGSHILSIGSPVFEQTADVDPSGSATIAREGAKLSGLEPYTVVYIQTNLIYAESIENGHSAQAPAGVYGLAMAGVSEAYR